MNRRLLLVIPIAIIAAGLLVFVFNKGRAEFAKEKDRETPVKTAARVAMVGREAVVTIDKATLGKSGIALSALTASTSPPEKQVYAVVLQVQDLTDARNGYAAAKAQLDKAKASVEVARKDYQRLNQLHNDDRNVSDKVFQAGVAALATEQANVQAGQVALQSMVSGVVQRYGEAIAGWLASDTPTLRRVLQQQEVLLQVTLPIEAATLVPPKIIRVQAADNVFASATLIARSPRIDPRVQGLSFFYLSSGRVLVPGMNVQAFLPTAREAAGVIVPQSAVVWWQGTSWIYVQRSPEHFARVEVSTEQPVKDGFFVRGGPLPDDQVVTSGAQLLLSEEFRLLNQVGEEGAGK